MFDIDIKTLEEIEKTLGEQDILTKDEPEMKVSLKEEDREEAIPTEIPTADVEVTPETTHKSLARITVPVRHNDKLTAILERVNQDIELQTMWRCANINAVDRLGISDHGRVHVQIVANIGLKMLRLLHEAGVVPSIVQHHNLSFEDAEVVVVLGALLHDIGICVHREEHEHHSLWLADRKMIELLDGIYDIEQRTIVKSEVLHAIIAHARSQKCLTIEAGVVKVADALDMAKGRSRIPFEAGHINIHSASAYAIQSVELKAGVEKPIHIQVNMSNSAGIFQIDELLKKKIQNSSIKDYLELVASIGAETEEKLIPVYHM
ncbi:HD domain-containing protein [Candidatus Chlorohelix allophototropha]|uniref:HD domain-containing protein n=1 Tax=Candidatus Chlorohelix allophototropha TaxID=3003348 RepID=A0ABY9B1D3_9CHLR|nr:HD domain-containing protein [Chloroflexota bacterium L227-S17]